MTQKINSKKDKVKLIMDYEAANLYDVEIKDLIKEVQDNLGLFSNNIIKLENNYAFNEEGFFMLSTILKSRTAVETHLEIIKSMKAGSIFEIIKNTK